MKQSYWASISFIAFMCTLAVVAFGHRLEVPGPVLEKLADAIWWGLPSLLAARGARDVMAIRAQQPPPEPRT